MERLQWVVVITILMLHSARAQGIDGDPEESIKLASHPLRNFQAILAISKAYLPASSADNTSRDVGGKFYISRLDVAAAQLIAAAPPVYNSPNQWHNTEWTPYLIPEAKQQGECSSSVAMAVATAVQVALAAAVSPRTPSALQQLSMSGLFLHFCTAGGLCSSRWTLQGALDTIRIDSTALVASLCLPPAFGASFTAAGVSSLADIDAACKAVSGQQASLCAPSPENNNFPGPDIGKQVNCSYQQLRTFADIQQFIRDRGAVLTRMVLWSDFASFFAASPNGTYRAPTSDASKQGVTAVLLVGYDNVQMTWQVLTTWGPSFGSNKGIVTVAMDAPTGIATPSDTWGVSCSPLPNATNLTRWASIMGQAKVKQLHRPTDPYADANDTNCYTHSGSSDDSLALLASHFGLKNLTTIIADNPTVWPLQNGTVAYSVSGGGTSADAAAAAELKRLACADAAAAGSTIIAARCDGGWSVSPGPAGTCDPATTIQQPAGADPVSNLTLGDEIRCQFTWQGVPVMGGMSLFGKMIKLCGRLRNAAAQASSPTPENQLFALQNLIRAVNAAAGPASNNVMAIALMDVPAACGWDANRLVAEKLMSLPGGVLQAVVRVDCYQNEMTQAMGSMGYITAIEVVQLHEAAWFRFPSGSSFRQVFATTAGSLFKFVWQCKVPAVVAPIPSNPMPYEPLEGWAGLPSYFLQHLQLEITGYGCFGGAWPSDLRYLSRLKVFIVRSLNFLDCHLFQAYPSSPSYLVPTVPVPDVLFGGPGQASADFKPEVVVLSNVGMDSPRQPGFWSGLPCTLRSLDLSRNALTGLTLPPTIQASCPSRPLVAANFSNSHLTGTFPVAPAGGLPGSWESLPDLVSLDVSFNPELRGCLPQLRRTASGQEQVVVHFTNTGIVGPCSPNNHTVEAVGAARQQAGLQLLADSLRPDDLVDGAVVKSDLAVCASALSEAAAEPALTKLCAGLPGHDGWRPVQGCVTRSLLLSVLCTKTISNVPAVTGLWLSHVAAIDLRGLGVAVAHLPWVLNVTCLNCTHSSGVNKLNALTLQSLLHTMTNTSSVLAAQTGLGAGVVVSSLVQLRALRFLGCGLTGALPARLPAWAGGLLQLSLAYNRLRGPLPGPLPTSLPNVTSVDLSNNPQLSGLLPSDFAPAAKAAWGVRSVLVQLSNCSFRGPIPDSWQQLAVTGQDGLKIRLDGNPRLTGCLPAAAGGRLTANLPTCGAPDNPVAAALATIKQLLDPMGLTKLSSWQAPSTADALPTYFCSYPGIICDTSRLNVVGLNLSSMFAATGGPAARLDNARLLAALGQLKLETLDLSNNNVSGGLPAKLPEAAPGLIRLDLSNNALSSKLPGSWAALVHLKHLDLSRNAIKGQLSDPANADFFIWPSLQSLQHLNLSRNSLKGRLPGGLGLLSELQTLDCSFNGMNGPLPSVWADPPGLQPAAQHAAASGVAAAAAAGPPVGLQQLQHLHLQANALTGGVPGKWVNLLALQQLELAGNPGLGGKLDPTLAALENLAVLDLSGCSFSGPLPGQWARLKLLTHLRLARNPIRGSLPVSWAALTLLQELDLENCSISGKLPAAYAALSKATLLKLAANNLDGDIPFAWGQLAGDSRLLVDLTGNANLTGCVPFALMGGRVRLRLNGTAIKLQAKTSRGQCCARNSAVVAGACQRCRGGQQPSADMTKCIVPPPQTSPGPVPPKLPPGFTEDPSYCNPDGDYDLTNPDDWDAINSCCQNALNARVFDPECTSLPPRPDGPPTPPCPNGITDDGSRCNASNPNLAACCAAAEAACVHDPDCDNARIYGR